MAFSEQPALKANRNKPSDGWPRTSPEAPTEIRVEAFSLEVLFRASISMVELPLRPADVVALAKAITRCAVL